MLLENIVSVHNAEVTEAQGLEQGTTFDDGHLGGVGDAVQTIANACSHPTEDVVFESVVCP